jgi:hypothetical protein
MRRLIVSVYLLLVSLEACTPNYKPVDLKDITGLWRYPDRQVWIDISDDGSLFQCRINSQGALLVSRGHFVSPHSFVWDTRWGTEQIENSAQDNLTIHHRFVVSIYVRPNVPMTASCAEANGHGR